MTEAEVDKSIVEVLSDDATCRYKIWDEKAQDFLIRSHAHHWQWISNGNQLTNRLRCGACGHVKEVPEFPRSLPIPNSHTVPRHKKTARKEKS